MSGREHEVEACVVVLVGVTADEKKIHSVEEYFIKHFGGTALVPVMPQWRGIRACSRWLPSYLEGNRVFERFKTVHFLNYISGGYIFRTASPLFPEDKIGNVVYGRGPVQELVPSALIRKYTWPLILLTQGKMITDLASDRLSDIPYSGLRGRRGLIIETGVSELARSLGLNAESVPPESWEAGSMLPGASDVLRVSESHDDVYTSDHVLGAALHFFRTGRFLQDGGQE